MNDFEPTKGKMEILIQQDSNYKTILAEGVVITTTPSDKIELDFYIRKMNKPEKMEVDLDETGELQKEGYQLNSLIPYSIKKIENEYVLDIQELEIYIFTENIKEGVKELCEEIIFKYEQVINIPDEKLGKFPRKWKRLLNSWITKL